MWIVRLALRRPYTFVVASLLLILLTPSDFDSRDNGPFLGAQ